MRISDPELQDQAQKSDSAFACKAKLLFLIWTLAWTAFGQSPTGEIGGVAKDASGAMQGMLVEVQGDFPGWPAVSGTRSRPDSPVPVRSGRGQGAREI